MDTSSGGGGAQLELHLGDVEAQYSNLVVISHTATEVVLDFAVAMPGLPKPKVVSRVIVTPEHAKRLFGALGHNLQNYEKQFGPIIHPRQKGSAPEGQTPSDDEPQP